MRCQPVVLFDCDGVMCPPMRFAAVLHQEHGITREMTKDFFTGVFSEALRGDALVRDLLPSYLKRWGWTSDVDVFLKLWVESEREADVSMLSLVQEYRDKGFKVCLATNQESHRARYMRTCMGFEDVFDELFISCELQAMKPDRAFYERITNALDASPEQIIFIDDQEHYVSAARDFGWNSIVFSDSSQCKTELAQLIARYNIEVSRQKGLEP